MYIYIYIYIYVLTYEQVDQVMAVLGLLAATASANSDDVIESEEPGRNSQKSAFHSIYYA